MRTLVITQNCTLDGAVEMLDDWFDPSGEPDPDHLALTRRQDQEADALVLGRRTFEDFRGYWPRQSHDTTGISDYLGRVQKYVVSSTMTDPQWQNSTVLTGDPVEQVRALKDRPGKDIVCTGSITLAHALIAAGLVDEYRLFAHPAVQGRGRRLFPDGHAIPELRLLDAQSFGSGVTYAAYQPHPRPDTGGHAMNHPGQPRAVDQDTWQRELDALRVREKAATRELDAIAAQRRRLPMVELPDYTLEGEDGPVRLVDVFDGKRQLITYHHMWFPGETWQCGGCTGFTSQFTRLDFLDNYDARFVVVTQGPIDEALAYRRRVGNRMTWYSTAGSPFGADVGAPPGGGFALNVFFRDGDTVHRTWHSSGRGVEQVSHTFPLIDLLPWGRQEEWQDSPEGWPQSPTFSGWLGSEEVAALYGEEPVNRPAAPAD